MPDDAYRLRRIAPDASSSTQSRNGKSPAGTSVAADAAAIEDIIRRTVDSVHAASPGTGHVSTSAGNNNDPPSADAQAEVASLRSQLASLQKSHEEAIQTLEQGRLAYATLEHKHQQFVDANVAFTRWRDDMELQRASWADANAKFAKRHEEHKAARANLEAKYAAVLADLEELKDRYGKAKKEIAALTGGSLSGGPPSPPLPSARPGGVDTTDKRRKAAPPVSTTPASTRSIRGVERDANARPPAYPTQLVEQSVLRERLTSDMFTLSQKVLEERATRAEEARQMAERRIFELESQLARYQTMSGLAPSSPPPDHFATVTTLTTPAALSRYLNLVFSTSTTVLIAYKPLESPSFLFASLYPITSSLLLVAWS
ncbi:hypothetical protein FRB99_000748 [Tulasnella sp. 403]|nr:hypothetical protein FRB99_000748 [Tulasnella sp. 403]